MKQTTKAIVMIFMSIFMIVAISGCEGDGVNGAYSPHNLLDEGIIDEPTENIAPTANAGADQTIIEGETAVLTCEGSDEDGEVISYSWLQGETEVATTQEYTTPTSLAEGTYTYTCEVTDADGATASDDVVVTVTEAANLPPVAKATATPASDSDNPIDCSYYGSDDRIIKLDANDSTEPEGGVLTYAWSGLMNGEEQVKDSITNKDTVTGTITVEDLCARCAGYATDSYWQPLTCDILFNVSVTDNDNQNDNAQVKSFVRWPEGAPT